MKHALVPKLVTVLKEGYKLKTFGNDLIAGTIVAIIALPLSIALAIASGVKPEQGLFTAVVAGFLISSLGGSRVQIGGPTGAFLVVVYAIVSKHGYEGLALATMMAGVLLIVMGLARLGAVIKYIPYPVTVGFTSGIALIIFVAQIRDFLGLQMTGVPAELLKKVGAYALHIDSLNPTALGLGLFTLAILILLPRWNKKVPASLVALLVTTLIVFFFDLKVETIGDRFGAIPNHLPMPVLPHITRELIFELTGPAITIAMLAGIESLLSAVVADGMTGRRHRSNMELVALGLANIASPLFSGIPATGAIARTAANIKNGGTTPIAGVWHAVLLLLIMLLFAPLVALIPMTALAAILIVVAYNMSEVHLFFRLFKSPPGDVAVLLTTFSLTVLVDLVVAIQLGVVLAALLFMRRMANLTEIIRQDPVTFMDDGYDEMTYPTAPPGIEVFEIFGPFFFGAAEKFQTALQQVGDTKVLIIRMGMVPAIDATAMAALEHQVSMARNARIAVIFSELQKEPHRFLKRAPIYALVGEQNIMHTFEESLNRARFLAVQNPEDIP